ncbi:MAG: hypothetical protein WB524_26425 [Acidobacteriaceae bacterium]
MRTLKRVLCACFVLSSLGLAQSTIVAGGSRNRQNDSGKDVGTALTPAPAIVDSVAGTRANGVIRVDQEAGSTADVQLNACILTLSGSGGGVCDATGYGYSTRNIAATVTTASNVDLLMSPVTTFQPSSASVDMFSIAENSGISGLTLNALNVTNYAGNAVKFVGNCLQSDHCYLRDSNLINGTNGTNPQTGTAILLQASSGVNSLSFVDISHVRITGFLNGMLLTSAGSIGGANFVNDTRVSDVVITNAAHCLTLYANPGDVQGNSFNQVTCEAGGGDISNATGFVVKGQSGSHDKANMFINGNIWDYGVKVNQNSYSFDSNSSENWLQANIPLGYRDHSFDAGTNNQIWNLGFALTVKQVGIERLKIEPANGYAEYWLTTNGTGNQACVSDGPAPGKHYDWCNDSSGNLSPTGHMNQSAARNFAGTCTMSGTRCSFTLNAAFTSTPICVATEQSSNRPIAASCSVSGATVTITASRSNSSGWAALIVGNPN